LSARRNIGGRLGFEVYRPDRPRYLRRDVIRMNKFGLGRFAVVLGAAALAVGLLASFAVAERQGEPASAVATAKKCKNAEEPVNSLSSGAVRDAVLCLINDERRRHARRTVEQSKALQSAAQRHTKKMVSTNCLSHQCPGEGPLAARIRRSGYTDGAASWAFAENTGCGLSAEAMVANWMASRYHRINIVDGAFEDIGVGYSPERVQSRCSSGYGTFTTVFAFRKN
jgi:uncharacterized protein YkwD